MSMNRSDFLAELRKALEGNMSAREVKNHIDYYSSYIQEEMQNGKSETEVLESLGDPWAIAKTILMSSEMGGQTYASSTSTTQRSEERYSSQDNVHVFRLDTWWKKAGVVVIVLSVISIIVSIISGLIQLIAPILIPTVLILLILRMFNKK